MSRIFIEMVISCFTAMGIVIGGALMGGLGAFLVGEMPLRTLAELAEKLKLWGLVSALGGTFYTLQAIDLGLFSGELGLAARQFLVIFSAFAGAHLGYLCVLALSAGGR